MNIGFRLVILVLASLAPLVSIGATIDDLRSEISEKNREILELEEEIAKFQEELGKTSKEADSLKNQINAVLTTISKLSKDISVTQKKIESAELSIEELGIEISDKSLTIEQFKNALTEIIRNMNELESQSLVEIMLANASISSFFSDIDYIESLSSDMEVKLSELKQAKLDLEVEKNKKEELSKSLQGLRSELGAKKYVEEDVRRQKNDLLKITKNKETEYQNLLADRLAKKNALESEIRSIEEELRVTIDPESLPRTGSGVLSWPLANVFITQYFGNTPFATQNPQIYNGGGHNGIDLRATVGTPIKSAADGRVVALGDTDRSCNGVSYGKWVLVEHDNNISTLYAHLSYMQVSVGDSLQKNQTLGYSGNTGYTTGPHLHFTVFATKGVQLKSIKSRVCGTLMYLPVASFNSYLNPLSYL
ncbi:MAG: peptidoglycan DD-metalloendopeptidase family protein [Patescibacteria group bacterium]